MTMVTDTKKSNFGNHTAQKMKFSITDFFTFCAVSKVLTVSYLVHYNTLLQNAADIIAKCDSYLIAKCDKSYDKMRQMFYYKM